MLTFVAQIGLGTAHTVYENTFELTVVELPDEGLITEELPEGAACKNLKVEFLGVTSFLQVVSFGIDIPGDNIIEVESDGEKYLNKKYENEQFIDAPEINS